MDTNEMLAAVRVKFEAKEAKFENGYLWLKGFKGVNTQKYYSDWTKTPYSEIFVRNEFSQTTPSRRKIDLLKSHTDRIASTIFHGWGKLNGRDWSPEEYQRIMVALEELRLAIVLAQGDLELIYTSKEHA